MCGGVRAYHCHHKHYRLGKTLSGLFSAIQGRTITEINVKRNNWSFVALPLAKTGPQMTGLTFCEIYLVILDRLVTGEYSGRINLVLISLTMVS